MYAKKVGSLFRRKESVLFWAEAHERATRVLKNLSTREVDGRFFVPNRRAYAQAVVECSTLLGLENE